jgi:hypothetical protein
MGTETGGPGTSLRRYAEMLACEVAYPNADASEIHERLKLPPEVVASARAYWPAELARELSDGDASSVMEFARAYGRTEQRLRLRRPPLERLERDVDLDRAGAAPPKVVVRRRSKLVTASPESSQPKPSDKPVPSYLKNDPLGRMVELSPAASPGAEHDEFGGTAMLPMPSDLARLIREADPRVAIPNAPSAPAAAAPAPKAEDPVGGGTAIAPLPEAILRGQGLPFGKAEAAGPAEIVSLEDYVRFMFGLADSEDGDEYLRQRGFTREVWTATSRRWADRIRGDRILGAEYDRLVAARRRREPARR